MYSQICALASTHTCQSEHICTCTSAQDTCLVHATPTTTPAHDNTCTYMPMPTVWQQLRHENYCGLSENLEIAFCVTDDIKKHIELNLKHDPNIQRKTCWVSSLDCHTAPVPHPIQPDRICSLFPFLRTKVHQNSREPMMQSRPRYHTSTISSFTLVRAGSSSSSLFCYEIFKPTTPRLPI